MLGSRTGRVPAQRVVPDRRTSATPSLASVLATIRRVAGMPDYAAHVRHLQSCHPGCPVPTERQFYEEFVRARYGDGPTRCC
jgi:uncharacterized short protein YbdD (DUF466 family)